MPHRCIDITLVTSSLLLYSFIAAPVPALNEPHYLAKAMHFWQPLWCAGDFFLESADAHTVFFATVGSLTTACSLTATAIIGRVLALAVLAWGWTALARQLELSRVQTMLSVWLFLALATCGNWSGEWLVGGVESKVFAYGLMFWAWSQLKESYWYRSALAIGVAIAFHPVVGLWGLLATLGAFLFRPLAPSPPHPLSHSTDAAHLKCAAKPAQLVIAALIVVITALPGLIPVLRIMLEPVDPITRYSGTYIQVYYRLGHHLDPMLFPLRAYVGYASLAVLWLCGWKFGPRSAAWTWLHRLTACSLVFALAGLAVGWGPRPPQEMPGFDWRMHLLKFYPFRLADVLLPLSVSFLAGLACPQLLAGMIWRRDTCPPKAAGMPTAALLVLLVAGTLGAASFAVQHQRYSRSHHDEWGEACHWVRDHAPRDAVVISPHGQWTFKWYGERAEYVNFKDCPQDVRGIVEWNRRQLVLTRWYHACFEDDAAYSAAELAELHRQTAADYLIADEVGPVEAAPVYQNATHRVYDLRVIPLEQ